MSLLFLQVGITDDTLHTPHIFPYISDVLPANSQILSEDNVEIEESANTKTECNSIKLRTNETQELMKDSAATSAKDDTLSADIISNTNVPIAPKLSPTQSMSSL